MKNNKLVCVILALLVCLSMVVSASAANESDLTFALESNSSVEAVGAAVVKAGETFTVNVAIEKNPGVLASIVNVSFDSTKLELTAAKALVENVKVPNGTIAGRVTVVVGNTEAAFTPSKFSPVNATGAVAELTFKVLEKTDIQTAITLEADKGNTVDANGKFGKITISGAKLNVNVVSADHKCDATKVIDLENGKDATCTEAGKETDLICEHCGNIVTAGKEIPALGHDFSGEGVITTEPGCETMGVRTYTCKNGCGATEVDDKVPAVGHAYGDWTVTKAATVEAEGEETRTCANCNGTEKRSIAKLPAPATQPTQPTQPTEPAAKGVSPWVIVAIVVVVLAGAGVAAFFVLKNKKK